MNTKSIVLLSAAGNIKRALHLAGRKGPVVVIALDETARRDASQFPGVECHPSSEYLNISESVLRDSSYNLSLQWYKAGNQDYTLFDGYSLGELLFIEVSYNFLFELERRIMLVQEINRLHSPKNWVLATDDNGLFGKIIKFNYAEHTVVKVLPILKNWARRNLSFREIKLWLRREGWDYHARKLVFWLLRWKRGNRAERPQAAGQDKIFFLV